MLVIPAIDLLGGQVVRLQEGQRERATVYNPRPEKVAERFVHEGAQWIHVVDLDGAFAGRPENRAAVRAICEAAAPARVQVGGGVRDLETCAALFEQGAQAVVLGTAAVKRFELVREACARWPGRVVVAVDARGGKVAVEGWAETSQLSVLDIARRFEDVGVSAIVYTDIARDGMLKGLNLDATVALADSISIPVIASGGLASIEDIKAMLSPRAGKLAGAIAGRALYDGCLDAAEALKLIRAAKASA